MWGLGKGMRRRKGEREKRVGDEGRRDGLIEVEGFKCEIG